MMERIADEDPGVTDVESSKIDGALSMDKLPLPPRESAANWVAPKPVEDPCWVEMFAGDLSYERPETRERSLTPKETER